MCYLTCVARLGPSKISSKWLVSVVFVMGGDKIPSCKSSQKATEEWEIAEVINPQDSAVSRIVFAEAVKNA